MIGISTAAMRLLFLYHFTQAARPLGINGVTLHRKLKKNTACTLGFELLTAGAECVV